MTATLNLSRKVPRWSLPLQAPNPLKGAKGGRSSGKSHQFAEELIEDHIVDPCLASVCIREVQKSLKYSAKRLLETKIRSMGVSHMFDVTATEIRRKGAPGLIIFQGMQDHTADSIKSLEGFGRAWVEEGQTISQRSLDLLIPTIRAEGSEIWVSWNPDQDSDPVDQLMCGEKADPDAVVVHVNYLDNPFLPEKSRREAEKWKVRDPDTFDHIWLGGYNTRADDQVLGGRWAVEEFDVATSWDGPYYGADWGFSTDPNTLVELFIGGNTLYVTREKYAHAVETIDLPDFWGDMPGRHVVRADSARPENVSHMRKHGHPRAESVKKWPGSVEDGISHLRSYDRIVIHPSCTHTAEEARLWKYKRDRLTGDVQPVLIDKHNHCWDAIRYALEPFIKRAAVALAM